jgi:hypothetical protein
MNLIFGLEEDWLMLINYEPLSRNFKPARIKL